jgi:hypothetical protein
MEVPIIFLSIIFMIIIVYHITNYYNIKKLKSCSIEYKIKSDIDLTEPDDTSETADGDTQEESPLIQSEDRKSGFLDFFMFN